MFWKIFNFFMGIYTGITLVCCVAGIIFAQILKRKAKNEQIRAISIESYSIYKKGKNLKSSIFPSFKNELVKVSQITNPDSSNPLLDLSINEIIKGLFLIQSYLSFINNNPLFKNLKKLTIRQILNVEEVIKKPIEIYTKNKVVKVLRQIWSKTVFVINILSPTLWVRRLLVLTLFKEGKKDIIISLYDVLGNTIEKIYKHSNTENKVLVSED